MNRLPAFTLIELLIVIALIGVIVVPLFVLLINSRSSALLEASSSSLANHIRTAHVFAREGRHQADWGVESTGERAYRLYYKDSSDTKIQEASYSLDPQVRFTSSFSIEFEYGSGETDKNYSVVLENLRGKKSEIRVLKTGVVEINSL